MIYYVIPARKGSKDLPLKNRKLFEATAKTVSDLYSTVIVSTDDSKIKKIARKDYRFDVRNRPANLATDEASTRGVLIDVAKKSHLRGHDIIIMLYLTYPERTRKTIEDGFEYFIGSGAKSMLCGIEPKTHPFMCIYEDGRQIVEHDLCRRQEYPTVFEISHLIFISYVSELDKLNRNLYNDDTIFWKHDRLTDIDTEKDLNVFTNKKR